MNRSAIFIAAAACSAVTAAPASAEIVKAPLGASSQITVLSSATKSLARQRVTVSASGAAKKKGSTITLPYSLARWDFAAREGDVVHFRKNTGLRFKRRGGRSISMVHPRVIMDRPNSGYITALISNVRVKTFTFARRGGAITDTPSAQRHTSLKLKLTKASAQLLNRGLRRKAFKAFTQFGTLQLTILKPAGGPAGAGKAGGSQPGTAGGTTPGANSTTTTPGGAAGGSANSGGSSNAAGGAPTGTTADITTPSGGAAVGTSPAPTGTPAAGTPASTPVQGAVRGSTVGLGQGIGSSLPLGSTLAAITPATTVDLNGDGQPDTGVFGLALKGSTLDATTRQGTVQLDGGFAVRVNGQDVLALDDPEIVLGATPQLSGLFALVNGVRVRVGDIDPAAVKLSAANGVVTVSDLDVRVSTPGALALNAVPGITGVVAGSQLLDVDLSVPQV